MRVAVASDRLSLCGCVLIVCGLATVLMAWVSSPTGPEFDPITPFEVRLGELEFEPGAPNLVSTSIRFRNKGGLPLRLTKIIGDCACTTSKWDSDMFIEPGQEGSFNIDLTLANPTPFLHNVQVVTNESDARTFVYRVSGSFRGGAFCKPKRLRIRTDGRAAEVRVLRLFYASESPGFSVLSATTDMENASVAIADVPESNRLSLFFHLEPRQVSSPRYVEGNITIRTNSPTTPKLTLPVTVVYQQ